MVSQIHVQNYFYVQLKWKFYFFYFSDNHRVGQGNSRPVLTRPGKVKHRLSWLTKYLHQQRNGFFTAPWFNSENTLLTYGQRLTVCLSFWADQIQFLASGNRYQNLKKLSDKLRHVECGISNCMFCLEWRCGKFIEFQKNKLIEEAENENRAGFIYLMSAVNIYDVCSNWISINQFHNNWFLPGIRWEVLIFYEQLPTVS